MLFTCLQPLAGSQLSVVHGLPSSQSTGSLTQLLFTQRSFVVHWSVSLHSASVVQQEGTGSWTQPVARSHDSVVHALLSSQSGGGPPTQEPPEHLSAVVQALPSSQDTVLFECVQPVAGLQPSVVQTLLSLQSGGGPPAQLPPEQ